MWTLFWTWTRPLPRLSPGTMCSCCWWSRYCWCCCFRSSEYGADRSCSLSFLRDEISEQPVVARPSPSWLVSSCAAAASVHYGVGCVVVSCSVQRRRRLLFSCVWQCSVLPCLAVPLGLPRGIVVEIAWHCLFEVISIVITPVIVDVFDIPVSSPFKSLLKLAYKSSVLFLRTYFVLVSLVDWFFVSVRLSAGVRKPLWTSYRMFGLSWAVLVKFCGSNFVPNQTSYDTIR